jgi:hypothetical protein
MKKALSIIFILLFLTGCMGRIARLEKSGDVDVDLDSNDAVDIAYGGTNATSAAAAASNLGAATTTQLTTHTSNATNPHSVTYSQTGGLAASHGTNTSNPHSVTYSQVSAEPNLETMSQAEAEAGVATTDRILTAQRMAQAIAALAPGGLDEVVYQSNCATITNGFCIDSDDGLAYYWDGDSVEQVGTGSTDDTIGWAYTPLSSAPSVPVVGKVYLADNDNWDPLSYVGATDYFVMRTAPGSWVAIIDVNGNWLFNSLQLPGHASNDASLSSLGQVFVDDAESAIAVHMGANGEVAGEVQISAINPVSASFDPKAICDGTFDGLALFTVGDEAPNGIIIDQWKLVFVDADPTTEVDLDLRYADSHPTRANSVVIDVLDTTAGVSGEDTDSNINSGLYIPFGKVVYLQFGTAYTEENHQISFELWYHA